MSNNPYLCPVAIDEPADRLSRLTKVSISFIVVLILWVLIAPLGIVYLISVIRAHDTEMSMRHFYTTNILYMGISILYSLFLITGVLSMVRRGSYVWAVATSWLAMVPMMGPFYVLGIPLGIWALFVLRTPSVRASFRSA